MMFKIYATILAFLIYNMIIVASIIPNLIYSGDALLSKIGIFLMTSVSIQTLFQGKYLINKIRNYDQ